MCTLILGRDALGPGTLLVAANRDEDPERPSDPPRVLHSTPRIVGGRDRRAGGTWLAVLEHAVVAMLNRRPASHDPAVAHGGSPGSKAVGERGGAPEPGPVPEPDTTLRSRGLLAVEVAMASGGDSLESPAARDIAAASEGARAFAEAALRSRRYAPFSLVFATAGGAWVLAWDGARTRVIDMAPGWHVITHAELDDPEEPRTRRLLAGLAGWRPASRAAAERGLIERLAVHDDPRVCLHEGRMQTVSYSLVSFTHEGARYQHGGGRPCEQAPDDYSSLLTGGEAHE